MMTLTLGQLKELKPCSEGFAWYSRNIKTESVPEILEQLSDHRWDWCRWLFVRLLNANQSRRLAIYCAELVLPIFESRFPDDKRPIEAIEASKKYLKDDIGKEDLQTKRRAVYAAADYAANAADAYAYIAAAADTADASMKQKIVGKVIDLLKEGDK